MFLDVSRILPSRFLVAVAATAAPRRCNFPASRLRVVSSLDKGDARPKEPKTSPLKLGNKSCSGVESTHANPIRIYFRFWRALDSSHLLLRAPRGCLIAAYGQISFVPSLISVSPILAIYLTYGHVGLYPLNWSLNSCLSTYRGCACVRARIYVLIIYLCWNLIKAIFKKLIALWYKRYRNK